VKLARLGILGLALCLGLAGAASAAEPRAAGAEEPRQIAGVDAGLPGALERTAVTPVELETHEGYYLGYFFAMTRGVAWSTLSPAVKPLLFVFTVPLDIALLPFAAIGGFFG